MNLGICFECMDLKLVLKVFGLVILAILFLQSGIDKIKDWKGNLGWLNGHFANSPLKSIVPLLLGILTVQEMVAGLCCLVGVFTYSMDKANLAFPIIGLVVGLSAFVSLFFGQRIAKDYAGAGGLVPYMIFNVFILYLFI
jgi:uncharacterized membrane protein YphA (DoxX/SURF4 family)